MIFASIIVLIFLVSYTCATKLLKHDSKYHIKLNSFGYHPEVGQVRFTGLSGEKGAERNGLRGLQTDYYLKITVCGSSNLEPGVSYYSNYILANQCLTVSTTGSGGFISAKAIVTENNDGTINVSVNYYTDNACSVGIKTSLDESNFPQGSCVSSLGFSGEYTSTVTSPTDGVFQGIYAGSCDTMVYGDDYGVIWGACIDDTVRVTGCDGTTLYGTSYASSNCGGTGSDVTISMNSCVTRTDNDFLSPSWEEDDASIGGVTLPSSTYDKKYYMCNQAPSGSSNDNDDNTGAIAGGVVGGIVGLGIIAGLIYYFFYKKAQAN